MAKRKEKIGAVILIILFTLIVFFHSFVDITLYDNSYNESIGTFSAITPQNGLLQELTFDTKTTIDAISVQFATYASVKTNKNIFTAYVNKEKQFEKEIPSANLNDNQFLTIPVHLSLSSGDTLAIEISTQDGTIENAITAWVKPKQFQGNLYSYNNDTGSYSKVEGEIALKLYTKQTIGEVFKTREKISLYLSAAVFNVYCVTLFIFLFKTLALNPKGEY